jgi:dUTP pyrophosphatase
MHMKLRIQKILPEAKIPASPYRGDAGMDIFSVEEVSIAPGEKAAIKTGLKLAIPEGYAGFVWDKSGLAVKHHIKTMAGVIDSNYRGELMIVLTNLGKEPYLVEKGSKIAQLIAAPIAVPEVVEEEINDETERGEGGFGSSGTV